MTKKCSYCKSFISDDTEICPHCGKKIEKVDEFFGGEVYGFDKNIDEKNASQKTDDVIDNSENDKPKEKPYIFKSALELIEKESVSENKNIKLPEPKKPSFESMFNEQKYAKSTEDYFHVMKFSLRAFISILDQFIILLVSFLYYLIFIKSSTTQNPYYGIEGIGYFLVNYRDSAINLGIFYVVMNIVYYSLSAVFFKSTPASLLMGYRLYNCRGEYPKFYILILRAILTVLSNVIVLFPFLTSFVSDYRQSVYDKIFKVYILKKSEK
ncbi:RDD family protein [bacterium]|nr:RDD family protein [bacterium]